MSGRDEAPAKDGAMVDLIFLWHMHQPDYRDHGSGDYALPWVYLHAIKDYTDMAAHLERHRKIRCVVNFVPVLLDQIEDYAAQFASGRFRDPLLRLLARPDLESLDEGERQFLAESCFRCHHPTMLAPFPRYKRLHDIHALVKSLDDSDLGYLSAAYFADLVTWYHLVWTGESERRQRPLITELMAKGEGFTAEDRQRLVGELGAIVTSLLPRYRALAERGQIELSATPATHPLAPLLLDFASAREAVPGLPLPQAQGYEGGRSRVIAQIRDAQASHAARFGSAPRGLWPAEGAISLPLLRLMAEHGVGWIATGAGVLRNSGGTAADVYRPHQVADVEGIAVLFRDEALSDAIGFEYARWHGRDAAANFVARVEAIGRSAGSPGTPLVTVALDGENAWEYYPFNAWYFFDDLYAQLDASPAIRTRTCADALADPERRRGHLPRLAAGSWVYGTFTTWIGDPDKNHAWDLLCAAKQSYDLVISSGRLDAAEAASAERQLAVCESSDWFWWLGGYNSPQSVATFEKLFRHNLATLYRLIGLTPPPTLDHPIGEGHGTPESGGAMRRATPETLAP